MSQRIVLVAVNDLSETQRARIAQAVEGWADCVYVDAYGDKAPYFAALERAIAVFGWPDAARLAASPVGFFQLFGVGRESYQTPELLGKPGFVMSIAHGVMSVPVAEHAIALMLAVLRRIDASARDQLTQQWHRHVGRYFELTGSTVCVLGLGAIGCAIAQRCAGLKMHVIGVTRSPEKVSDPSVSRVFPIERLHEALALTDHLMIATPLTPQTRGLIGAAALAALRPGACLYNVARGDVVDQPALIAALASGRLAAAGLDVTSPEPLPADHPLWRTPNVLITPHVAGRSHRVFDRMVDLFVSNLRAYRRGEPVTHAVIDNR